MLVDVHQDIDILQKEIFGPVIPVIEFTDFDEEPFGLWV